MPLTPPATLSPSKVSSFKDCALAFRFSAIDKLPEPPSIPAVRGSLVHRALELLFDESEEDRTIANALTALSRAVDEFQTDPEFVGLALDAQQEATFVDEAEALVRRYFELEDPQTIRPIGLEVKLEAVVDGVRLRGIIDRLELDDAGELVVTDYKTGRAPPPNYEQRRLDGVQFYSLLCESNFGKRPARVQLLYLSDPIAIVHEPTEQSSRGLVKRVGAVWKAVERACADDDFRPRPGKLCDWCGFKAFCPSFGGDPAKASEAAATTTLAVRGDPGTGSEPSPSPIGTAT